MRFINIYSESEDLLKRGLGMGKVNVTGCGSISPTALHLFQTILQNCRDQNERGVKQQGVGEKEEVYKREMSERSPCGELTGEESLLTCRCVARPHPRWPFVRPWRRPSATTCLSCRARARPWSSLDPLPWVKVP